MENKYIIIAAIIGFIGTFFEPHKTYEIKNKNYKVEEEAEICIDSLRHVNDSLIEDLKMKNKFLKNENIKLKRIRKHQW
tara:strand:+ start:179 stop:415 length:237 start_codon:yes stop_codon:yes gene_type:complete